MAIVVRIDIDGIHRREDNGPVASKGQTFLSAPLFLFVSYLSLCRIRARSDSNDLSGSESRDSSPHVSCIRRVFFFRIDVFFREEIDDARRSILVEIFRPKGKLANEKLSRSVGRLSAYHYFHGTRQRFIIRFSTMAIALHRVCTTGGPFRTTLVTSLYFLEFVDAPPPPPPSRRRLTGSIDDRE